MQFSEVVDLPGPPLLERLFLVSPIPAALAALFIGLVLFEVLRRGRHGRAATAAFAVGAVAAAVILAIGAVTVTAYEEMRRETERFVDRAVAGDRDTLEDMLSDRFVLMLSPDDPAHDADWMLDRIEGVGMIVRSNERVWRGGEMRSDQSGQARMTVRTEVDVGVASGRYASSWDFYWQRDASGVWKLMRLEALSLVGQRPWRGWGDHVPLPRGR